MLLTTLPVSAAAAWPFTDKSRDEALTSFVSDHREGKAMLG